MDAPFRVPKPLTQRSLQMTVWGLILVVISACQPFKPEPRALDKDVPRQFSLYSGAAQPKYRWWESFNDPDLNRLVESALADNLSLHEAWARLRQSRALAIQAGAGQYPDLTGSADYLRGRTRSGSGSERDLEEAGLAGVSRYEIDLWGRVRAQQRSALLREAASREDLNTAAVTIAAEVTQRYIAIVAQRMQKALLEEQLRINRTLLELVDLRFRKAMVSALDVYQQKQLVDGVLAEIPLVEQQEALLTYQLAVLVGQPPLAPVAISREKLPEPTPLPATGLPADLLAARPDVRAAGLRLQAADWQIAQARANRLPALSLTARARYGQGEMDVLFDNWLVSLAANLTAPIVDGGSRRAEVERTRALADEQLAAYRDAVLTAIREVEDALLRETKQREHLEGLRQVAETAKMALDQAAVRYRNGLNDYLPVLTQLLSVQNLDRTLITTQADLLTARISLYRALGGTWPDEMVMPASN